MHLFEFRKLIVVLDYFIYKAHGPILIYLLFF